MIHSFKQGLLALVVMLGSGAARAADPVPVASYAFNNTLASSTAGAPALTATNPLGLSGFVTDTVMACRRWSTTSRAPTRR